MGFCMIFIFHLTVQCLHSLAIIIHSEISSNTTSTIFYAFVDFIDISNDQFLFSHKSMINSPALVYEIINFCFFVIDIFISENVCFVFFSIPNFTKAKITFKIQYLKKRKNALVKWFNRSKLKFFRKSVLNLLIHKNLLIKLCCCCCLNNCRNVFSSFELLSWCWKLFPSLDSLK